MMMMMMMIMIKIMMMELYSIDIINVIYIPVLVTETDPWKLPKVYY